MKSKKGMASRKSSESTVFSFMRAHITLLNEADVEYARYMAAVYSVIELSNCQNNLKSA